MIQAHVIDCVLYFYYYYIVIYSEIIIQPIIVQISGSPELFLQLRSEQPRSSHVQFMVEFELLQESNAAADKAGGRVQVVMPAMGSTVNTDEASLACPPLTSCCVTHFLTVGPGVGDS